MPQFTRTVTFGFKSQDADTDAAGQPLTANQKYLAERLQPSASGTTIHPGFLETLTFGEPAASIAKGYHNFTESHELSTESFQHRSGNVTIQDRSDTFSRTFAFTFKYLSTTEKDYLRTFYQKVGNWQSFTFTDHLARQWTVRWVGPLDISSSPFPTSGNHAINILLEEVTP